MNRLEPAVRAVMVSLNIAQLSDAAQRTGIPKSALSKILRGDIGLSPENLQKLVNGLSSEPAHQFEILKAHLYDEAARGSTTLAPVIQIRMGDATDGQVGFSDLPLRMQRQLRAIADRVQSGDKDLGAALQWLASSIDMLSALPLAAEEQAPYDAKPRDPAGDILRARAAQPTQPPSAPKQTPPAREKEKS